MARSGGGRRGTVLRSLVAAAALGGAALLAGPASAARADTGPPAAADRPDRAGAVDERHLGPVSTAAIGGVLVAGALWARRQRAASDARV